MEIKIIFEDKNIIVAEKSPGMPSQQDKTGDISVLDELSEYLGYEYKNVIHRLDRPVGGLMVFGKTGESIKKLSAAVTGRAFQKSYYAVCFGNPGAEKIILKDYLVKDSKKNMSFVSDENDKNAKEALLEMKRIQTVKDEKLGEISLLKIKLITGRHHQIRVQLSNAGFNIVGDRKYGKDKSIRGIKFPALFSGGIRFKHPVSGKMMEFKSVPKYYPFNIFDFNSIIDKKM